MPEKDPDERLSLDLPSLFGRRRKKGDPTPSEEQPEPAARREPAPPSAPSPDAATAEPEPTQAAEPVTTEPTRAAEPVEAAAPEPTRAAEPVEAAAPVPTRAAEPRPSPEPADAADSPREQPERRRRSLADLPVPDLPPLTAVALVGLVTGLLGVGLTALGLVGCELVTGAATCGGPGLLILVAIVVAMVFAGAAMLRMFAIPDAGSLSFLGVGVMVVVTLLFLLDDVYDLWMVPVIPVVTALGFLLARWVTVQLSEEVMAEPEELEAHDIR